MGWRFRVNFEDGSSEESEDIFESEEDAKRECNLWKEGWYAGMDVLGLAGEAYSDKDIDDFDIWEE